MRKLRRSKETNKDCPRYRVAVELIGRRWNGAIIRSLLSGRLRFSEIAERVSGISARLLCERLRELESAGVVDRHVVAGPPIQVAYSLTRSGAELDATVDALAQWAERWIPIHENRARAKG